MFQGKMKALTFSYDDGVFQDRRLIKIFNKYGIKCTFNLNSDMLGSAAAFFSHGMTIPRVVPRASEIAAIYQGHEVAAHTLSHAMLPNLPDEEVIREVENDRRALSEIVGYDVVGLAYPNGGVNYDQRVVKLLQKHTGIRYARTLVCTNSFDRQTENLLEYRPTVSHNCGWDNLFRLAHEFVALKPETPKVFYIWGHSYEFDKGDSWEKMEELCSILAEKDDIFYGTNKEVLLCE